MTARNLSLFMCHIEAILASTKNTKNTRLMEIILEKSVRNAAIIFAVIVALPSIIRIVEAAI